MFLSDAGLIDWIDDAADRAARAVRKADADTPIPSGSRRENTMKGRRERW
jgi:hypothetical protein